MSSSFASSCTTRYGADNIYQRAFIQSEPLLSNDTDKDHAANQHIRLTSFNPSCKRNFSTCPPLSQPLVAQLLAYLG